jgi:hypothetical protein
VELVGAGRLAGGGFARILRVAKLILASNPIRQRAASSLVCIRPLGEFVVETIE